MLLAAWHDAPVRPKVEAQRLRNVDPDRSDWHSGLLRRLQVRSPVGCGLILVVDNNALPAGEGFFADFEALRGCLEGVAVDPCVLGEDSAAQGGLPAARRPHGDNQFLVRGGVEGGWHSLPKLAGVEVGEVGCVYRLRAQETFLRGLEPHSKVECEGKVSVSEVVFRDVRLLPSRPVAHKKVFLSLLHRSTELSLEEFPAAGAGFTVEVVSHRHYRRQVLRPQRSTYSVDLLLQSSEGALALGDTPLVGEDRNAIPLRLQLLYFLGHLRVPHLPVTVVLREGLARLRADESPVHVEPCNLLLVHGRFAVVTKVRAIGARHLFPLSRLRRSEGELRLGSKNRGRGRGRG
eukprot:Hpha_TRINITY_DN15902_c0_g10::TRINITY_DN15902_c0_g10_i1::g.71173::m.71173